MDRQEYIKALKDELKGKFSKDEFDNIIEYYEEYFEDAGIENESAVIKELGSPKELAKRMNLSDEGVFNAGVNEEAVEKVIATIEDGNGTKDTGKKEKNNDIWIPILIAIVTAPIWIPAVGSAIGAIVTLFSLNIAFYAAAVALILASIVMIPVSICVMFETLGTGFLVLGIGFILAAIGIAFLLLSVAMTNLIIKIIKWLVKLIKKEEV